MAEGVREYLPRDIEAFIDEMEDGVAIVNRGRVIQFWNRRATLITGFEPEDVVDRVCSHELLMQCECSGAPMCEGFCPLSASMGMGPSRYERVYIRHKSGFRVPVSMQVINLGDEQRGFTGALNVFSVPRDSMAQGRLAHRSGGTEEDEIPGRTEALAFLQQALDRLPEGERIPVFFVRSGCRDILPESMPRRCWQAYVRPFATACRRHCARATSWDVWRPTGIA